MLWLPLLDGSERLGVLAVTLSGDALNDSDEDPTRRAGRGTIARLRVAGR